MQVTDYLSLGIAPKYIEAGTQLYTAKSKNGVLIYVLNDCVFAELHLTFDISGNTDYGSLTLKAGQWMPGVKSFALASGFVLVIDPKHY